MLSVDYFLADDIFSIEAFAKGGKKGGGNGGKKNCKKQQCGNSCIATNKTCRKDITAAGQTTGPQTKAKASKKKATTGGGAAQDQQPAAPVPAPAPAPKQKPDPNKVTPYSGAEFKSINKSFDLEGENKGSLSFSAVSLQSIVSSSTGGKNLSFNLIKAYSVDFKVNDTHDAGTISDSKAGVKSALKIRKEMQAIFENLPDGTIVHNTPYNKDKKGKARAALYERFGFGKPIKQTVLGDKREDQYGMVIGGKVYPLDRVGLQQAIQRRYQQQQEDLFG